MTFAVCVDCKEVTEGEAAVPGGNCPHCGAQESLNDDMERPMDALRALARQYQEIETTIEHYTDCEFLRRKPPRSDDCDCSFYTRRDDARLELAEQMVEILT